MRSPWPTSWPLRALALVWSAPLGLAFAIALVFLWPLERWQVHAHAGAIELVGDKGPLARWMNGDQGTAATTLGWCIAFWSEADYFDMNVHRHERRHVRQFLVLGPFMAGYLAALAGQGYEDNFYEVDARAHETAAGNSEDPGASGAPAPSEAKT